MASRRDQLQSYQFRSQRVVTAFVMRETDPAHAPLRRGLGALLIGAMVAVLVAAGFGVYGILTKTGSTSWKSDGAVVVEKETGAAFVYADGRLHPTLNYASALLASSQSPPSVYRVPANSLAGTPRAATIGIPGAPDSLPDRGHLARGAWTVCSLATVDGSRADATAVTLAVGGTGDGATAVPAADGVLVANSATGALALLWNAHRYRVDPDVRVALFADIAAVRVGPALLDTLPTGHAITPIAVPGAGQPSAAVPGHRDGEVLVAQTGSGPLYYLVFDDGVATITELQKDSLGAGSPATVDVGDAQALPKSARLAADSGPEAPPAAPPHLAAPGPDGRVCAEFPTSGGAPALAVGGHDPGVGVPTTGQSDAGTVLADTVAVPAGRAALVVAQPSAGFSIGGWFLVTDTGIRYPVPTKDDVRSLGYDPAAAQPVAASVLARVPVGPTLDRPHAILAAGSG